MEVEREVILEAHADALAHIIGIGKARGQLSQEQAATVKEIMGWHLELMIGWLAQEGRLAEDKGKKGKDV